MDLPLRHLAISCLLAGIGAAAAGADATVTVTSGGQQRSYLLHLPPSGAAASPLPLVIALHGGYGTGAAMRHMTGFDPMADADGFIVAYPDGLHGHWADGRGTTWPDQHGIDDVAFIAAVIDDIEARAAVDSRRIFATGISNGGMMCQRLGLALGKRIAAIAPVAGNMPTLLAQNPPTGIPAMPVLMINGTADTKMPYAGGAVDGGGTVLSVDATIALWRSLDHVGQLGNPITMPLPDLDPNDGCTVDEIIYPGGRRTQEVLYEIIGGGHTWPGEPADLLFISGNVCRDISASAVIWSYFSAHPKLGIAG